MDYVIDNDVVITLYEASKRGMRHPLLGWVKRHRGRIVFSELARDELRDMERRGKLCPGDAQNIINILRKYEIMERPARKGVIIAKARHIMKQFGLS